MKILICFGTRPEWLKIKPIIKFLDKSQYHLLFTGQHTDLISEIRFDFKLKIIENGNRLNDIISSCLNYFHNNNYDYVLVQGDTASAFACALSAFNNSIKIVHLEAGLRTYDIHSPYPEESYRQMISRISSINFCPTIDSYENLKNEKVFGKNFIVGNTVLDNILEHKNHIKYGNEVLVTLHRRENHEIMDLWFQSLNKVAEENSDLNFIIPIHPNPNVLKYKKILNSSIKVIKPLSHENLIKKLINCKFVITDSGGIQEEATFLNKKSIVCRKNTERPEGINTGHIHLCENPNKLNDLVFLIKNNFQINQKCPYGDGRSSEKIIKILLNDYSNT